MKMDTRNLRVKMIESGMSIKEIAELSKLDAKTISRLLGGGKPHFVTVYKIAKALKVPPSEFLTKDE